MTLYSYKGSYPQSLPFRIRLSDGRTRTDPTSFTAEEIADAGYTPVADKPTYDENLQFLNWNSTNLSWVIIDKTTEQIESELNQYKQSKINLINELRTLERNKKKYFQPLDTYFDADETSLTNIQAAFSMAFAAQVTNTPFSVNFTDAYNVVQTLDTNNTILLGQSVFSEIDQIYTVARSVKDDILVAADKTEVDAIYNSYIDIINPPSVEDDIIP